MARSARRLGLVAGVPSSSVVSARLSLNLSARAVGLLTGFGAGALIAAVVHELVDEAGRLSGWRSGRVGLGLVIGSLLYLLATGYWASLDRTVDVSFRSFVVTVVPEAVIIVGSLLNGHYIGLAVIVAVFLCGVPEAFVATVRLIEVGRSRGTIVLVWAGLALVCGSAPGWPTPSWTRPATDVALVLAFAAGRATELTTKLVPEKVGQLAGPLAGTAAVIGFAIVFILVEVA